jgi:hypothetical protein
LTENIFSLEKTRAASDSDKQVVSSTSTTSHPPPHVEEVVVTTKAVTTSKAVPPTVVATTTLPRDRVSQPGYVTETSAQSPHGASSVNAEQVAPAAAAAPVNKGPITSIRNFFKNLFSSSAPRPTQGERQKSTSVATASTTTPGAAEVTTTTTRNTTVATSNLPPTS